jgi:GMP synthase (glutamine-hydrolysing)
MQGTHSADQVDYIPPATARFLLLQMRSGADEMRSHEVECFARSLNAEVKQIETFDLLTQSLTAEILGSFDIVFLGGAGEYSATANAAWLHRALDSLREVHHAGRPTFASCWGFQAMARALGGHVINDVDNAEVGTLPISLTPGGHTDELFGTLPPQFEAPMGHEDHVVQLPPDAVHLARSEGVLFQAFRFADRPIYCTQFHPELTVDDLIRRVKAYPEYLERIAGVSLGEFIKVVRETPESGSLLQRFAKLVLD